MAEQCPIGKAETLLLCSDGSEYSEGAIRGAIALAKRCSSMLYAVTVIETNPEYSAFAPDYVEKAEKEAKDYLDSIKARAAAAGQEVELLVHEGEQPYLPIVEEAEERGADMIIMGRRGRSGITRLLMGSVTARVIGHAPCNVLVIPKDAELKFNVILAAIDGSDFSETAARNAVDIAKKCACPLIVMSVAANDAEMATASESAAKALEMAQAAGVDAQKLVVAGEPYEAIVETAKEKGADLIVVGSHGRTGIKRLLMGSVAERVIGHAECAVLVAKVPAV